jgi:glutaredoxin
VTNSDELTLLTRTDCHLCEEARRLLERLRVAFGTIEVDGDAALVARYGDAVPVLLRGNEEIGRAPFTRETLTAALRRAGVL